MSDIVAPNLATNTPMYRKLEADMDINCGEVLDGGLGDHEFMPWQFGITG